MDLIIDLFDEEEPQDSEAAHPVSVPAVATPVRKRDAEVVSDGMCLRDAKHKKASPGRASTAWADWLRAEFTPYFDKKQKVSHAVARGVCVLWHEH